MIDKIKRNTYLQIISLLGLVIPVPSRFACGIIIGLFLIVFVSLLACAKYGLQKIDSGDTDTFVLLLFCIFLIIILKNILGIYSAVLELLLGFALYFIPVSSVILSFITDKSYFDSSLQIVQKIKDASIFVFKLLLFYLFRELLAYGTISFPARNGIKVFTFFDTCFAFWGTIPGAYILMSIILAISIFVKQKIYAAGRIK